MASLAAAAHHIPSPQSSGDKFAHGISRVFVLQQQSETTTTAGVSIVFLLSSVFGIMFLLLLTNWRLACSQDFLCSFIYNANWQHHFAVVADAVFNTALSCWSVLFFPGLLSLHWAFCLFICLFAQCLPLCLPACTVESKRAPVNTLTVGVGKLCLSTLKPVNWLTCYLSSARANH